MGILIAVVSCAVSGAGLVLAAVYMLAGLPAALLCAGVMMLGCAALLRRGMRANG